MKKLPGGSLKIFRDKEHGHEIPGLKKRNADSLEREKLPGGGTG
jgi:hypothetical protein